MKRIPLFAFGILPLMLLLAACKPAPPAATPEGAITNYDVRGVVRSLKPAEREVVIKHEEIPGYMMAMTMPFSVRDTNELRGVKPGDGVQFRMRVTEKDGWIDQLRVVSNAPASTATNAVAKPAATATNTNEPFRVLPNVPDLKVGDLVPDYRFTNQLGQPFRLADLRGQAVAVTFIFTRCPFPLFCPRMSDGFAQAQRLLLARPGGPTNWHLLSLTFDPDFDTPATMRAYGERWKADFTHWTLATGSMEQIEPLAVSVGLYFGRGVEIANQNHNLRTLVIDPQGRLKQILVGNQWTPEELADALTDAAKGKG